MRQSIRILVALFALAGIIAWTMFTVQVWQWGHSFTGFGVGDGAGNSSGSPGAAVFGFILITAIWFLPVSPYLCMAGGAFNLITGKALRVAYVYSLVALVLMTLAELVSFHPVFEFMAMGNIVISGLWVYAFRGKFIGQ
ncbi:MAG TPA: hypothetical protein VFV96_14465 [Verrucomicrobiae bacterium]|nr:hypothetical protein [Verrucomicrobiae bacterium]